MERGLRSLRGSGKLWLFLIRLAFVIGILSLPTLQALAQRNIRGTVTDAASAPVIGANVTAKGANIGTTTDIDGKFELNVPESTKTLVFSFIGYTTTEVEIGVQSVIEVTMAEDALQLNEVVVTALGITKEKSRVGYSVQDVQGADLVKAREPNPISSLTGKVAGLNIGISPELLGGPQVLLRGKTPLYVVDGIPIQTDTWNISPDDIQSITVLKGPAASALYGSRGQNGAIQITTKRGTKDARGFSVEFNSSQMVETSFLAIPKVQDEYGPGDHGRYAFQDGKGAGLYDSDYDVWGPRFEGQLIPQYDGKVDPSKTYTTVFYQNLPEAQQTKFTGNIIPTPWVARGVDNLENFLRPGFLSTNNIAISAQTDKADIRFSGTYTYQQGIVPNSQLNSGNFNISTGYQFSDRLRFDANLNYNRQFTDNYPDASYGPNSVIYNISIWGGADWSVDELKNYWQEGKEGIQQIYADYTRYNNPWFMAKEWLRGHTKTDVYGYASLKYKIAEGLDILARTQVTSYDLFRSEKFPYSATVYGREQAKGDYREDRRNLFENNTDLLLSLNRELGANFDISASLGGNIRSFDYASSYATTDYLNVPGWYNLNNSLNPRQVFNFDAKLGILSAYGFVDLSYKGLLNLSLTGRWDKNSTLPQSNNNYFYPSASLSVLISDMVSMPDFVTFFKLRGSYAYVGGGLTRSTVGPSYLEAGRDVIDYGSDFYTPFDGPAYTNSAGYNVSLRYNNEPSAGFQNQIVNPNLEPSFSSAYEFGADLRFFKNRLGLDVTYFRSIEGPGIFQLPISTASGYGSLVENGIETLNRGWEVVLSIDPIKKANFTWGIDANWSTFKSTLEKVYPGVSQLNQFVKIGDRTDKIIGSEFVRTPDGQIINDASGRPIVKPVGQFLGYTNPDWTFGIVNRFSVKNFTFSFQVDGRIGGNIINYIRRQTFRGGRHIETVQGEYGEARANDAKGIRSYVGEGVQLSSGALKYDVDGNVTNYGELQFTPNTTATFLQDYISRFNGTDEGNLMDRSYAKLREVTISYSLPSKLLGGKFFKQATISLVGRNLLYFAEFDDVDLDQYVQGYSFTTIQTPTQRRFGVNLNFVF